MGILVAFQGCAEGVTGNENREGMAFQGWGGSLRGWESEVGS